MGRNPRRPRSAEELIEAIIFFLRFRLNLLGPRWYGFYADLRPNSEVMEALDEPKSLCGFMSQELGVIIIDIRCDQIATIVHECLHGIFPQTKERTIRKLERRVMKALTADDAAAIHCLFAKWLGTTDKLLERIS